MPTRVFNTVVPINNAANGGVFQSFPFFEKFLRDRAANASLISNFAGQTNQAFQQIQPRPSPFEGGAGAGVGGPGPAPPPTGVGANSSFSGPSNTLGSNAPPAPGGSTVRAAGSAANTRVGSSGASRFAENRIF